MFAFSSRSVRRWTFDVRCSHFSPVRRCGWLVDVTVDSLAGALEEALALSNAERLAMGQRCLRLIVSGDGTLIALLIFFTTLLANRS